MRFPNICLCGVFAFSSWAVAQVPAGIEAGLRKIGPIVDPACTAKLYRPLMPAEDVASGKASLYKGMTVTRDQAFGADPKDVVDIFVADKGPASRPVLIFVPGGAGDKIELQNKEANAFYDNIGRWAAKNGMIGVTMQRKASMSWDGGAKDVSKMMQWVQENIAKYHGNPDRMFIWAHSAGNMPLGTYIGRPELHTPKGVGVKGVIFMSAAAFNIAPLDPPQMGGANPFEMLMQAGKTCGASNIFATDGALPGRKAGEPGGPATGLPGMPPSGPGAMPPPPPGGRGSMPPMPGFGPPVDAATRLAQSSLPELRKTTAKILLANAELDPGADMAVNHGVMAFNQQLHDELCKAGPDHCPTLFVAKNHSHMSIVFSLDTPDQTVARAILNWIKGIK